MNELQRLYGARSGPATATFVVQYAIERLHEAECKAAKRKGAK